MENKETPFLDFYKNHVESGIMNSSGLCVAFGWDELVNLFAPTEKDCTKLGIPVEYLKYISWFGPPYEFNELRQNVVLFCAAINNEL